MSTRPTLDQFTPYLEHTFRAKGPGGEEAEFRLVEANDLSEKMKLPEGFSAPFSLLFRGPVDHGWGQGLYDVSHDDVGAYEMFCVPVIDPTPQEGRLYEVTYA